MKRILIISHAMEIGGAERALIGLLNSINFTKYQVDLFLCRQEGELIKNIPDKVNILKENQARFLAVPIERLIKERAWKILYGRIKGKLLSKLQVKRKKIKPDNNVDITYSHLYTYKYFDFINPDITYDLVISFLTPHYIGVHKCNAKKRLAWIHTDYSTIDIDTEKELEMWKKYDFIASISDKCTESFLYKFPSLKEKIIRIDNIITNEMIQKTANAFVPTEIKKNNDSYIFCSIGRFSNAKNFDNVPSICKYILDKKIKIIWYLIGFGGDEKLIRQKIKESGMEDYVIILGKKENPYPYIKACDFYIQPSRYEGKAVTVREAQILCKPVIITKFPTSSSQLVDGYDGVIVPLDNEGCAKGIIDFINNKELQNRIMNNLKNNDYSNAKEVEKIYRIMGEM